MGTQLPLVSRFWTCLGMGPGLLAQEEPGISFRSALTDERGNKMVLHSRAVWKGQLWGQKQNLLLMSKAPGSRVPHL